MTSMRRDMPGWRRIALPASIVLNLFLIALIGGHLVRNRLYDVNSETPLVRALARAEATLPPRDAAAFGAVMRRDLPRFAAAEKQLTDARQELRRQITAEQFNEAGVRQALDGWQAAWNRFFNDFSNPLVDALAQVSPEGRHKLVAARQPLHP
jgi:uncharacterized membrane protein